MHMSRRKTQKENILQALVALSIIVLLNIVSHFVFTRIDLTTDKRYTLTGTTRDMLRELEDVVYFKVYLDGDLPPGFNRLQRSTLELLDEFRAYAGDNIQYTLIDPAESEDEQTRNEFFNELYHKGLDPTNLNVKDKDGSTSQKIIFPGLILSYNGYEFPVNILKQNVALSAEANLQSSIQALEYEISFAIKQLTSDKLPLIGFIEGHGEPDPMQLNDIAATLSQYYGLVRVHINNDMSSLQDSSGQNIFDLIVIAQPREKFSEADKLIIDQHIMRGGNALWLIDNVEAYMDSLATGRSTIAIPYQLNLDDQLFTYGVRINPNLIQDMQCAVIPVNSAMAGQEAKFVPAPWVFSPLLLPSMQSPITKNVDMVKAEFVSSIDFVGEDQDIKKTVLLQSSNYSRALNTPVMIDLSLVNERLEPRTFNQPNLKTGVLLEGTFTSVFKNRPLPKVKNLLPDTRRDESAPARMIFLSDGDLIKNRTQGVGQNQQALPLGYDRFTKQTFGNKEFLVNCVNYLCHNESLMETRAKEYQLRLLDKAKISKHRLRWQILNVALPIFLTILAGFIFFYFRKRKYTR